MRSRYGIHGYPGFNARIATTETQPQFQSRRQMKLIGGKVTFEPSSESWSLRVPIPKNKPYKGGFDRPPL